MEGETGTMCTTSAIIPWEPSHWPEAPMNPRDGCTCLHSPCAGIVGAHRPACPPFRVRPGGLVQARMPLWQLLCPLNCLLRPQRGFLELKKGALWLELDFFESGTRPHSPLVPVSKCRFLSGGSVALGLSPVCSAACH